MLQLNKFKVVRFCMDFFWRLLLLTFIVLEKNCSYICRFQCLSFWGNNFLICRSDLPFLRLLFAVPSFVVLTFVGVPYFCIWLKIQKITMKLFFRILFVFLYFRHVKVLVFCIKSAYRITILKIKCFTWRYWSTYLKIKQNCSNIFESEERKKFWFNFNYYIYLFLKSLKY